MDLSSSIQHEGVGFIKSRGDCWHKQTWNKDLIKPSALKSHAVDEDSLKDYVSIVLNL